METQELYRGRLIDHVQLVVRDITTRRKFYEAVFHGPAKKSAEAVKITF